MVELSMLVGIIIGICQVVKGLVPSRFMPVISLLLGVVVGTSLIEGPVQHKVFYGIALGLAACGLFDVAKLPLRGKRVI